MAKGQIESTLAVFEIARELYWQDIKFEFIRRSGHAQRDYDLRITYPDGRVACAETKCRIEETPYSVRKLEATLSKARKQLPRGQHGLLFIKIPDSWMDNLINRTDMTQAVEKFLRNTTRVVSVKLFSPLFIFENGAVFNLRRFCEITNPRYAAENWNLLIQGSAIIFHTPTPAKWIKICNDQHDFFMGAVNVQAG